MSGWRECKLGDIATLHYGKGLKAENRIEGNIPVFSSAGLTGYHNQALTDSKGLVIGRKGTVGKVYYSEKPFWCIDTAYYVLPNESKYNLDYLYYFIQTLGLEELNEDSAVPGLNRETAYSQNILIPELPEQQAIAAVLSSLDDKIDLLHRQNKTLEAMAGTLFKQWFVVEAREDWEEGTLNDVISVKGGTTPSTKEPDYWNGTIYWTSPRDLSNHSSVFMFDTERKITEKGLSQIGSGLLPIGTVLLSSRAPIGYLAITEIPVAINQGYIGIICDKIVSNYFIYLWCKSNLEEIKNSGNGSVFQEISKSTFKEITIFIPRNNLLSKFDKTVSPIFLKIKINQKQIQTLETLRDNLLPKLMNSEVRVKY
jgi:type I restriction enzyme S subunit